MNYMIYQIGSIWHYYYGYYHFVCPRLLFVNLIFYLRIFYRKNIITS